MEAFTRKASVSLLGHCTVPAGLFATKFRRVGFRGFRGFRVEGFPTLDWWGWGF